MSNDLSRLIPFGENHERKLFDYSLKSADDIGNGAPVGATFDENGMLLSGSGAILNYIEGASDLVADYTKIDGGWTASIKVKTEDLFNITGSKYIMLFVSLGTEGRIFVSPDSATGFRIRFGIRTGATTVTTARIQNTGKGEFTEIRMVFRRDTVDLIVDELWLAAIDNLETKDSDLYGEIRVGNRSGNDFFPGYMKEFFGLGFPNLPTRNNPNGAISIVGDSLMQQGNFESTAGIKFLGTDTALAGEHDDVGFTPSLGRFMTKANKYAEVRCYAVGGQTAADAIIQVDGTGNATGNINGDALLNKPPIVVMHIGMNNQITGTLLDSDYDDSLQALIDQVKMRSPKSTVMFCEQPSFLNRSGLPAQINGIEIQQIDYCVAAAARLVNKNTNVHLVKLFNEMGGYNPDPKYFKADDNHYSGLGSQYAAELVSKRILQVIGG